MFKRRFRLPSPALVISMIALSLVLGGTAFAAATATHKDAKADKKLVKQLAPSLSVKHATSADSATNATHATSADSATNATTATNATNATHATSATSATNATTAATASALGGVHYVVSTAITNNANSQDFGSMVCPAGTFATGGGAFGEDGDAGAQSINSSFPFKSGGSTVPNAWGVWMNNTDPFATSFNVYVICIAENGATSFLGHNPASR